MTDPRIFVIFQCWLHHPRAVDSWKLDYICNSSRRRWTVWLCWEMIVLETLAAALHPVRSFHQRPHSSIPSLIRMVHYSFTPREKVIMAITCARPATELHLDLAKSFDSLLTVSNPFYLSVTYTLPKFLGWSLLQFIFCIINLVQANHFFTERVS